MRRKAAKKTAKKKTEPKAQEKGYEQLVLKIEEKRKEISKKTGVEEKDIRARADISELIYEGIFLDLDIGYWRGFSKVTAEDLGIEIEEDTEEAKELKKIEEDIVSLGKKRLLSKDILVRLNRAEQRARKGLVSHSYETPFGRFIPWTALESWKKERESCERELFQVKEEILKNYETLIKEIEEKYTKMASLSYKRKKRRTISDPSPVPEAFVQEYLKRVFKKVPTKEEIKGCFYFKARVSFLPSPSSIEKELKEKALIRAKRELEEARLRGKIETERRKIEALNRMVEEEVKEAREQYKTLIEEGVAPFRRTLNRLVFKAAQAVLTSMDTNTGRGKSKKKPVLVGRAAVQLKNLITSFENLNFLGEDFLVKAIISLKEEIERSPAQRDTTDIAKTLVELEKKTKEALTELGEPVESKRYMFIKV